MTTSPSPPRAGGLDRLAALGFNLVPVIGVLFWGWSAFALVFLYWMENLIVGIRTLASMLASGAAHGGLAGLAGTLFIGAFFTVHYGIFCFVHGMFVATIFGPSEPALTPMLDVGPFDLPSVAASIFDAQPNLAFGLAAILAWQIVQFALFLARGEARRVSPMGLMGEPYPRIVALHITIILGGMIVMALKAPVWGVLVLALMKTGFDLAFLQIGKKRMAGPPRLKGSGWFAEITRDRPSP